MPRVTTTNARAGEVARALGAALNEARVAAGLSHPQLANALGLSRQAYSDLERGVVSARIDQIDTAARLCGTSSSAVVQRAEVLLAAPLPYTLRRLQRQTSTPGKASSR